MGHGKGKSSSSREALPAKVAAYNVTGSIAPDATCNYFTAGTHGGKPYYLRNDSAWCLWWSGAAYYGWVISRTVGVRGTQWWYRGASEEDPEGMYGIGGGVSGYPFVSAGPH